jgi:hypothetical protein
MINITRTGDTELWAVMKGAKWSVPFYCDPCEDELGNKMMACYPAVAISESPIANDLHEVLKAKQYAVKGYYRLFKRDVFQALFTKCPGVTPDAYFWEHKGKKPSFEGFKMPLEIYGNPDFNSDFIDSVWRRTQLVDQATFKMVYKAILQEMGPYLLHRMKPIDFGWFKVGAVPFRVNWKQALLAKFPYLTRLFKMKSDPDEFFAKEEKVLHALHSPQMMSVFPTSKRPKMPHVWGWSLEVVPSQEWATYSHETEKARINHYPDHLYVSAWAKVIEKLWPFIHDCLRTFVVKTMDQNAALVEVRNGSVRVLVPRDSLDSVHFKNDDHRAFHLVSSSGYIPEDGPPFDAEVSKENAPVPEVPPVQPDSEDLRVSG